MTGAGRRPACAEAASGPLSAVFGLAILLGTLLLATQTLVHLMAASTLTAATFDAARMVAGAAGVSRAQAEAHARALLGRYGEEVRFDWSASTDDEVVLHVEAPTPARLVGAVGGFAGLDRIAREVRIRREVFVEAPG